MKYLQPFLIILVSLLLFSCSKPSVDESKPYGVEVNRFRSYHHAKAASERLIKDYKMGSNVILVEEDSEPWYLVVAGAEEELADIREFQREIEMEYGFEDTKIFTYFTPDRQDFSVDEIEQFEQQFIDRNYPAVSNDIRELIAKTPVLENFTVMRMSVMEFAKDEEGESRHGGIFDITTDLPRGVGKTVLSNIALVCSEAVLIDNLFGDRVTLNVAKLPMNHGIENPDVAGHFADLILNTGNYRFEEKTPIEVESFDNLSGYKVTIEPEENYFRTYYVLLDRAEQWLVFVQSTDKSEEELIEIVESFGTGQGMLDYSSFNNCFMTLPDSSRVDPTDIFVGFSISKIGWGYAQSRNYVDWANGYVGHWQAKGFYHNEDKGAWTAAIFDLLTDHQNGRLRNMYIDQVSSTTSEVDVQGRTGRYITERRWSSQNWEYYTVASEVNFISTRYTCMVDNSEYSWLGKAELLDRANWLQVSMNSGYRDPQSRELSGTFKGFLKVVDENNRYTEVCVLIGNDGREYRFPVRTSQYNNVRRIIGLRNLYNNRPQNDEDYVGEYLNSPVIFTWATEEEENSSGEIEVTEALRKVVLNN